MKLLAYASKQTKWGGERVKCFSLLSKTYSLVWLITKTKNSLTPHNQETWYT